MIEIGPGRGALTSALLAKAERVAAIEVDPVLVEYLRQKYREPIQAGRLEILAGDVLKTDLGAWGPAAIAGNLPYYITSPILERVFASPGWLRAVFLMQKEVAERITAAPGSRDYGYLSVLAQAHAEVRLCFTVPPGAFRPPPKVESAVVLFTPRAARPDPGLIQFAGWCFAHKRKTLRNNLAAHFAKAALDAIPETARRAEQLTIAELAALRARLLS